MYKKDAIQTELYEGSASFKSGSFIWTTKSDSHSIKTTHQIRMCGIHQFYNLDQHTCDPCPFETYGTLMFQQIECQSCAKYWNESKDESYSIGFTISLEICDDPQTVYLIEQQEALTLEIEKEQRYAEFDLIHNKTANDTYNSTSINNEQTYDDLQNT